MTYSLFAAGVLGAAASISLNPVFLGVLAAIVAAVLLIVFTVEGRSAGDMRTAVGT